MTVSTRSNSKSNPNRQQQGLKEKLKALTLLYEQQKFQNDSFKPHQQQENHRENLKSNAVARDKNGNRIMVFVRVRPLAKKEKEAGSRCCVKIVNSSHIYMTEFATPNDYLRLKRVRGGHFTFDACFSDSATQHQVYSTSSVNFIHTFPNSVSPSNIVYHYPINCMPLFDFSSSGL